MSTTITRSTKKVNVISFFVIFVSCVVFVSMYVTPAAQIREDAYRANNIGVAHLEQFDYPAAAQSFRGALELAPDLAMARVNLAIALFYSGDLAGARREAETAKRQDASLLHADYILGLVARGENRDREAIAAFMRVQQADPGDVGSAINLGQLYLQQQKFEEAVDAFRRAISLEPYQSTAAYGLATALLRGGAREEGSAAMSRFQELRDSGYATTFSQNYLDQGRYAAAIASTGAETALVDTSVPDVAFRDVTSAALPGSAGTRVTGTALFDVDADGDLDLAVTTKDGVKLLLNERGRFTDATARAARSVTASTTGAAAGDYDNDGRIDLLVPGTDRTWLLHQQPDGTFADVTARADLPASGGRAAAWSDADHDGDLDILLPPFLLRNNGNGTFTDVGSSAGVAAADAIALVPTDFDNRRDIDFLVLRTSGPPALFQNMRNGSFRNAAETVGLKIAGNWAAVASADVNKDGYTDFFFGRADGRGAFATSDGRGRFTVSGAPSGETGTLAAQFVDYDNDGLIDLVTVGQNQARVWRNVGTGWEDVSARAWASPRATSSPIGQARLAAGDLDGDGDTDLVAVQDGGLSVWRNEGGNKHASLSVRLSARVSNRSSIGARVEMRAGSLSQQIETSSATPSAAPADVVFGLGSRDGADAVRVLWPAGILQAEVASSRTGLAGTLAIKELDRKPSSCPYLYTWNGTRFEFVTDFLGGGEMGYWLAPGVRNTPDSDEYVRIESAQLQPLNGRYELRITNELEEALFLDRVQLLTVAHPKETDIFPNEGMGERAKPHELYVTGDARPPIAASDEHGHDVLDRVSRLDRTYPDDFALERVRGYARPHSLTLTLPARRDGDGVLLLLTGWTDYAFSSDNVAASQQGLQLEPPSLEVRTADGRWRTLVRDIGVPVGRPQTVPVDLTGLLPANATDLRIRTTMRIYWDRVLVAKGGKGGLSHFSAPVREKSGTVPFSQVPLLRATLRWRGFSAETSPDGREPFVYDYTRVSVDAPWKLMPGRYTREGDVRELLTRVDDMFVVSRPGDEIALSFDAGRLPAIPEGWTRTFLLYADGFSKEMDPHSASPDQLGPLPFHAMSRYPYEFPERYPDDAAHRAYIERYNTRTVLKPVPNLALAIFRRMQDRTR